MKERIRRRIHSLGADVCGFSDTGRFRAAPDGYRPGDIFPACQSVIVLGVALPKGLMQVAPRLIYGHFNEEAVRRVDDIAFDAAKMLETDLGCTAVPLPCDSPYEYWNAAAKEGRGLLSMKHAAVLAGLGSIGKSALFLNRKYGNRLCIGAILTDLELTPDELSGEICLEKCRKCIDNCPIAAITADKGVSQCLCRSYTYNKTERGFDTVDCNTCRTVCPMCIGR